MLKIFFGDMPDVIYNTSVYFDNTWLDNWFQDEMTKKIIKSIDKGEIISPQCIMTKALGAITARGLSGGTKTLLLMRHKGENIYNASTCGDNCAKWILAIAKARKDDLLINLYHIMNFGDREFEIMVLNNQKIVHNMRELILIAGKFI